MGLTVADMLLLEPFRGSRVVAGRQGLTREVRAVAVMEVPDVIRWLSAGDVLLTTGYPIMNDTAAQVRLVKDLAALSAAALVVKPRRFLSEIPEAMIHEADQAGLTVIEFPTEVSFMEVIKTVMARVSGAEVEVRYRQEFLRDLVAGDSRLLPDEIGRRALSLGWTIPEHSAVLVASGLVEPERVRAAIVTAFEPADSCAVGVIDAAVVVIFPVTGSEQPTDWQKSRSEGMARIRAAAKRAEASLRGPIRVGVGRKANSLQELRQSYRTAKQAHDLGGEILGNSCVIHFDDLGVYRILLSRWPDPEMEVFCQDVLGALVAYDRQHDTRLVETLAAYLRHNGSKAATAQALFIHLNTLKHRLSRIEEILRLDLDNPEHRLSMHIALKISSILR